MSYDGYSWSCGDVLSLLREPYNQNKAENLISCPFCGGKRFAMNIAKGTGHCFSQGCKKTADSASYYAAKMGISVSEARKEIKERLNIQDKETNFQRFVFKEVEQSDLAPIEVRDNTYRAFLDKLVLSQKNRDNLLSRGFSNDDIVAKGYKTFPAVSEVSFEGICRQLLSEGCILKGVPGFFRNKYSGEWTFVRVTKGIIIPQINVHNQVEGFQIRKDDDLRVNMDTGELEGKCSWFSSKNYPEGTGAKTTVHIATDFKFNTENQQYEPILYGDTVTLTEGGMKADLCQCILESKVSFIAIQGVHALNPLKKALSELKQYGLKRVNLAYDMDFLTNENVQDAMKKTEALVKELGLGFSSIMNWDYEIKVDAEKIFLKGIDDYLAYTYKHVVPKVK